MKTQDIEVQEGFNINVSTSAIYASTIAVKDINSYPGLSININNDIIGTVGSFSTIVTSNINPYPGSSRINVGTSIYLDGNLHAENKVGYFGLVTAPEVTGLNVNVSTLTGKNDFGTGVDIKVLSGLDMRGNNLSNLSTVSGYYGGSIDFINDLNMNFNDIKYVNIIHLSNIQNDSGGDVKIRNILDMDTHDINNIQTATASVVNSASVNTDTLQTLTSDHIDGNGSDLANFGRIKATTLFGDYIQAYTGSGITFNSSIDMNGGYIANTGNINSDQVHIGTSLYVDSVLPNSNSYVSFGANDVSNINNLYATTGVQTNLVYTNYLASSNGKIYLQSGTDLDGSTYQSLSNFSVVQGASGTFNSVNAATINTNSAPNITMTSDLKMSNNNIINITGLSSIYLSTNVIKANLISTNSLFVSSINNKQYPYTSTLNTPPSTFSYAASNTQSRTVPYVLYSNVTFPNAGWFNVSQKAIFTRASGTADTHQSILYTPGAFISTPSIKDGYAALPYTNQNNNSTFTTLTTEIYVSTTQLNRNIIIYNDTNNNFVGNLFMDRLVATYNPSRGYNGE
jgi:hypothetical protein